MASSSSSASAVTVFHCKNSNDRSDGILLHTRRRSFSFDCPFLSSPLNANKSNYFSLYSSSSNKKKSTAISAKLEQKGLEYRKVGDSDLLISEITLGTVCTSCNCNLLPFFIIVILCRNPCQKLVVQKMF